MKHIKPLAIKFISSLVLLSVILGLFFDMSFGNIFLITLVLGVVSYVIGDLFILPRTNNIIATLADFGLAFLVIRFMSDILARGNDGDMFTMSLIASIGVALFEYAFHKYVANRVLNENQSRENQQTKLRYQTEASEELTPKNIDARNKNEN
ncbi:MAG TPA: YndM family protein, partial [Bacillus sp. (in: firmicutes)]